MTTDMQNTISSPIPELKPVDWDKINERHLVECHEELVPASLIPDRILVRPQYFLQKLRSSLAECYVRQGVLNLLVKAGGNLPANHKLVLFDTWRPLQLQQELFDRFRSELAKEHPHLNSDQLTQKTRCYVALPSADPQTVSPHITGGAVDLSIVDPQGNLLDMGTCFDDTSAQSHTRFYEEKWLNNEPLTAREQEVLTNRRLLYHTMIKAGFSNYPHEWWHYDYGNKMWAWNIDSDDPARYGKSTVTFRWG